MDRIPRHAKEYKTNRPGSNLPGNVTAAGKRITHTCRIFICCYTVRTNSEGKEVVVPKIHEFNTYDRNRTKEVFLNTSTLIRVSTEKYIDKPAGKFEIVLALESLPYHTAFNDKSAQYPTTTWAQIISPMDFVLIYFDNQVEPTFMGFVDIVNKTSRIDVKTGKSYPTCTIVGRDAGKYLVEQKILDDPYVEKMEFFWAAYNTITTTKLAQGEFDFPATLATIYRTAMFGSAHQIRILDQGDRNAYWDKNQYTDNRYGSLNKQRMGGIITTISAQTAINNSPESSTNAFTESYDDDVDAYESLGDELTRLNVSFITPFPARHLGRPVSQQGCDYNLKRARRDELRNKNLERVGDMINILVVSPTIWGDAKVFTFRAIDTGKPLFSIIRELASDPYMEVFTDCSGRTVALPMIVGNNGSSLLRANIIRTLITTEKEDDTTFFKVIEDDPSVETTFERVSSSIDLLGLGQRIERRRNNPSALYRIDGRGTTTNAQGNSVAHCLMTYLGIINTTAIREEFAYSEEEGSNYCHEWGIETSHKFWIIVRPRPWNSLRHKAWTDGQGHQTDVMLYWDHQEGYRMDSNIITEYSLSRSDSEVYSHYYAFPQYYSERQGLLKASGMYGMDLLHAVKYGWKALERPINMLADYTAGSTGSSITSRRDVISKPDNTSPPVPQGIDDLFLDMPDDMSPPTSDEADNIYRHVPRELLPDGLPGSSNDAITTYTETVDLDTLSVIEMCKVSVRNLMFWYGMNQLRYEGHIVSYDATDIRIGYKIAADIPDFDVEIGPDRAPEFYVTSVKHVFDSQDWSLKTTLGVTQNFGKDAKFANTPPTPDPIKPPEPPLERTPQPTSPEPEPLIPRNRPPRETGDPPENEETPEIETPTEYCITLTVPYKHQEAGNDCAFASYYMVSAAQLKTNTPFDYAKYIEKYLEDMFFRTGVRQMGSIENTLGMFQRVTPEKITLREKFVIEAPTKAEVNEFIKNKISEDGLPITMHFDWATEGSNTPTPHVVVVIGRCVDEDGNVTSITIHDPNDQGNVRYDLKEFLGAGGSTPYGKTAIAEGLYTPVYRLRSYCWSSAAPKEPTGLQHSSIGG